MRKNKLFLRGEYCVGTFILSILFLAFLLLFHRGGGGGGGGVAIKRNGPLTFYLFSLKLSLIQL